MLKPLSLLKIILIISLSLGMLAFILFYSSKFSEQIESQKTLTLMGTSISLKAYGKNSERALVDAEKLISHIESLMSTKQETSEISQINLAANKNVVPISPETSFVISKALEYTELTNGAFDPTLGYLIDLWGIGTDHARIPSVSELSPYINKQLYQYLHIERDKAYLSSPLAKIDLGAIAKGFAGDSLRDLLVQHYGIESAILNLGGNVVTIGQKPDGSDWIVGLQNPLEEDRGFIVGKIVAPNCSIVTSGNYERYFIENGKRYHHILDSSTGFPAESDVISTTIISKNGIDADALSTATYILGKDKGLALIESLEGIEGIFITQDKHIYTTSGITSEVFTLTNKEYSYEKN